MGVKFFGQFLIERGEIDAAQLRSALDLMERENLNLGELAVKSGFATGADCRRVNGEQRRLDRPFGELALQMGVLGSVELDQLLDEQQQSRVSVAEALASLEHVSADRLSELEDDFKRHQDHLEGVDVSLPLLLEGNCVAERLVEMFPRYCLRMARLEAMVGEYELLAEPSSAPLIASMMVVGSPGVEMALAADRSFAQRLGAGISGLSSDGLGDELCLDALGEFLNVLAGNVMGALTENGREYRLEAPCFGESPHDAWSFEIASNHGPAAFILAPR